MIEGRFFFSVGSIYKFIKEKMSKYFFIFLWPLGKDWYLVRLSLTVTDVNDNVPEWAMEPFPFLAVVSPEAAGGTEVYKLRAVDADEGSHGAVEYFLLEGKF